MKKLVAAAVLSSTLGLSGCAVVMDMRAHSTKFDMVTVSEKTEAQPMKSKVYKAVKTVAIADYSGEMGSEMPDDNKRLYKAYVLELQKILEQSSNFKVVDRRAFRRALEELDLDEDIYTLESDEAAEVLAKVGKKLGVHAVINFDMIQSEDAMSLQNQAKMIGQVVIEGAIKIPVTTGIRFVRSKTGETLWYQQSNVEWITGSLGLKSSTNAEVRSVVRKVLEPIVNQALKDHS